MDISSITVGDFSSAFSVMHRTNRGKSRRIGLNNTIDLTDIQRICYTTPIKHIFFSSTPDISHNKAIC